MEKLVLVLAMVAAVGCGAPTQGNADAAPWSPGPSCVAQGDEAFYCRSWAWTWGDAGAGCWDQCPAGAACTVDTPSGAVVGVCHSTQ